MGAGPQRDSILTYDWDGTSFVLTRHPPYEVGLSVLRGGRRRRRLRQGNPARAVSLYRNAVEDTSLKDWKEESGTGARDRDELVPYARFRLYLTQLILLSTTAVDTALILVGSIEALVAGVPE